MVCRPPEYSVFEFAVVASLRAAQLSRGCTPRVDRAAKVAITAQMEVAAGKVAREPITAPVIA